MAQDHGDVVNAGFALKKAGNELMSARSAAARSTRSTSASAASTRRRRGANSVDARRGPLKRARDTAIATVQLGRRLRFPRLRRATTSSSSLCHPDEYPLNEGGSSPTAVSTSRAREYRRSISRSSTCRTRLRCIAGARARGTYFVGPLARYGLNFERLPATSPARRRARRRAWARSAATPIRASSSARVELVYACDEALRIIDAYEQPDAPGVPLARARRHRLCRDRGAARPALPSLPARRRRHDPGSADRPAHLAEPGDASRRTSRPSSTTARSARRGTRMALRTDGAQLRPVHLLRHPLPRPRIDRGEEVTAAAFHCEALRQVRARAVNSRQYRSTPPSPWWQGYRI